MLTKIITKAVSSGRRLLGCTKGASSELLAAVGLIAITAGIITVVSPTIRTNVGNIVTAVLARAQTLFETISRGVTP